ncbi:MAG TPA: cupin domain-containing protein [Acidobacteriaceae bacterium]|nr:cupin domain-containing protein [Acidobacteriaceae bacterium]
MEQTTGAAGREKVKAIKWAEVEVEQLSPQIGRQFLTGTNVMLARFFLKKGATIPLHSHHHEQVAYVLEGALRFVVDGSTLIVRSGEVLCIPPGVAHEAVALEDTINLDIFNPPRQDWLEKQDAYLRQGAE